MDETFIGLLTLDRKLSQMFIQTLFACMSMDTDTIRALETLCQILSQMITLLLERSRTHHPPHRSSLEEIGHVGTSLPDVSRSRGRSSLTKIVEANRQRLGSMDGSGVGASAGPSADYGSRGQYLHPESATNPSQEHMMQNATEVVTLHPAMNEPQTEEQEEETRNVELNLWRWSEQEKMQRRNSRSHSSRNHSALPTHSTGLVRRLSKSITSRQRNTHSYDNAFEMVHPGNFSHKESAPDGSKRNALTSGEEGRLVSPQDPNEQQALQADNSHSYFEPEGTSGDLGSASFDELDDDKATQHPPDRTTLQASSIQPAPEAYASGSPHTNIDMATDTNMSDALARIRSGNFPSVTVGRASSLQSRGGRSERRATSPLMIDTNSPPYVHRNSTHRGNITAIPEVNHQDEADVASGTTSVATASDPFASPLRGQSEVSSTAANPDSYLGEAQSNSQNPGNYARPTKPMQLGKSSQDTELNSASPEKRWFWSDMLLGCGLCSTADQDEEQAAFTNPME
ncbi:hypothetical protein MYAM1_000172 [Malassezia yamatoensis]|uniref:Uncharacterized protein n=1 Tax=Malassezia yamatoensis TaxID=253288 RepID=A0AAJ5YNB9_9BASI|nr:hypothetical protein MYAM1_000172 [Malassezia yamatoensis]